ncbi:MAG: hypothetical protein LBK01_00560 [Burkholderiaceae bacterium]|jgi:type VI secretion system protein ImpL|nr:hypothetical protein [Burkholderiaceae bacterium]
MGKVLSAVLKILLILVLLAGLGGLGFWLHQYEGWSYLHLGLILLGAVIVVLLVYGARRWYYRRREKRFIRSMIDHDAATLKVNEENERINSLREHWQEGMRILRSSRLRVSRNPVYALPWFMVIGEPGAGKSTAIACARALAYASEAGPLAYAPNTQNCDWWFFEKAVILDTAGRYVAPAEKEDNRREWRELLSLVSRQRRREPLNGIILVIPATRLMSADTSAEQDYGRLLRQRLSEVAGTLGADIPVYILISKMDRVLGLTELASMMPVSQREQVLGLLRRDEGIERFLQMTMAKVQERLREIALTLALKVGNHSGRCALFAGEFSLLYPGLSALVRRVFGDTPYSETPLFRGLFFSSGRQEGAVRANSLARLQTLKTCQWKLPDTHAPLFLDNLFSVILPRERAIARFADNLVQGLGITRNLGYMVWLGVLLSLCVYFTLNFAENRHTLVSLAAHIKSPPVWSRSLNEAIAQMDLLTAAIRAEEERVQSGWWRYPGYPETHQAIDEAKERYVQWMRPRMFYQHDTDISRMLASHPMEERALMLALYCEYLAWMDKVFLAAGRGDDLPLPAADLALDYMTQGGESLPLGNPALARVFSAYIEWEAPDMRERIREQSNAIFRRNMVLLGNYADWITQWLQTRSLLAPVQMGKYWPQASVDWQISRAYTPAGRQRLDKMLADLSAVAPDKAAFQKRAKTYLAQYANDYRNAWWNMAAQFDEGIKTLKTDSQWRNTSVAMATPANPYFLFIRDMMENLKAVDDIGGNGAIDKLPDLFVHVLQTSRSAQDAEKLIKSLEKGDKKGLVEGVKEKLQTESQKVISGVTDQDLSPLEKLLTAYLKALEELSHDVGNHAKSLQMASAGYGNAAEKTSVSAAYEAERALEGAVDKQFADHQTFWKLVRGPTNFFTRVVVGRSACLLNHKWVDDVTTYHGESGDETRRWQLLFDKGGRVEKFVEGPLKPFIGSTATGYKRNVWFDQSFPLRDELLAFISVSREAYVPPEKEYKVTIKALPVNVNAQAEKPHHVRLSLTDDEGVQVLDNYNFPVSKTFVWRPQKSSKVKLEIAFATATISVEWTGIFALRDFLKECKSGVLTLTKKDFEKDSAILGELDVEQITLRFDIKGRDPVLALQDPPTVGRIPSGAAECPPGLEVPGI